MVTRASVPDNYISFPGTVINTCESATGFAVTQGAGGAAVVADSTYIRPGYTASLKVTTPSSSGSNTELSFPEYSKVITRGKAGVWVYVPDYTKLTSIIVFLGKDASYTDNINRTYSFTANDKKYNGWHFISFQVVDASDSARAWTAVASGAPPGTYVAAKLRITPVAVSAAGQTSIWVGPMFYDYVCRPKLMIWGDDGYDSFYDLGISYLDSVGLKCSLAVIPDQIGQSGYMTLTELQTAYATGHDVAVHGETSFITLGAEASLEDLIANQNWITSNGMPRAVRHFVYPNGDYQYSAGDQRIKNMLVNNKFLTARGTVRKVTIEPFGFVDGMYNMNIIGHLNTDTLTNVVAQIDNGIANGQSMVLMFHKILQGAGQPENAIEIQEDDATYGFQQIIDAVVTRKNQGLLDVVTISEWCNGLTLGRT